MRGAALTALAMPSPDRKSTIRFGKDSTLRKDGRRLALRRALSVLLVYILVPKTDDSRVARDGDVVNTAEDRQDGMTSNSGANGATPGGSQGTAPEQGTTSDVSRDAIATNPGSTGGQQTPRPDTGGESEMTRPRRPPVTGSKSSRRECTRTRASRRLIRRRTRATTILRPPARRLPRSRGRK